MAKDAYRAPEGFATIAEVQVRLGVSRPTLLRLLKAAQVNVYEDPRDRRIRLLRVEDLAELEKPRLKVA